MLPGLPAGQLSSRRGRPGGGAAGSGRGRPRRAAAARRRRGGPAAPGAGAGAGARAGGLRPAPRRRLPAVPGGGGGQDHPLRVRAAALPLRGALGGGPQAAGGSRGETPSRAPQALRPPCSRPHSLWLRSEAPPPTSGGRGEGERGTGGGVTVRAETPGRGGASPGSLGWGPGAPQWRALGLIWMLPPFTGSRAAAPEEVWLWAAVRALCRELPSLPPPPEKAGSGPPRGAGAADTPPGPRRGRPGAPGPSRGAFFSRRRGGPARFRPMVLKAHVAVVLGRAGRKPDFECMLLRGKVEAEGGPTRHFCAGEPGP